MEKKVIKINLVGAICVIILAIAIIVGLIVGIPKLVNKSKNNAKENHAEKFDENKEFLELVTNEDGDSITSKTKTYKSDLGYSMRYDYELFTVEKNVNQSDRYISLYSNTIGIVVMKQKGMFNRIPEMLNSSVQSNSEMENQMINQVPNQMVNGVTTNGYQYENPSANSSINEDVIALKNLFRSLSENVKMENVKEFYTTQIQLAGRQTYKRTVKNDQTTDYLYCIKIDDENFYVIHAYCGEGFTKDVLPVIENMIESFTILEENNN